MCGFDFRDAGISPITLLHPLDTLAASLKAPCVSVRVRFLQSQDQLGKSRRLVDPVFVIDKSAPPAEQGWERCMERCHPDRRPAALGVIPSPRNRLIQGKPWSKPNAKKPRQGGGALPNPVSRDPHQRSTSLISFI